MTTQHECYQMAENCEEKAAVINNADARRILLNVAAQWRLVGNALKAEQSTDGPHPRGSSDLT